MVFESVPAPESHSNSSDALARALKESHKEIESLRRERKQDAQKLERLERDNQELRRRLDHFIRTYFGGRKSEKISPDQLELALQGLVDLLEQRPTPPAPGSPASPEVPAQKPVRSSRPRSPRRALDDGRLEERQTVIEPEEVQDDPSDWTHLGEERTVQLDYEPGRLFRHVIIRPRYVRKEQFAIAALPAQPIDKGMVGAGLLAWLLMSKYADHLPLYRLTQMLARQQGVEIPRSTLAGWVDQAVELLRPVYRAMQKKLQKKRYLQVDETPTRYLDPDVKGTSQLGYFWVYLDPGKEVLFQWSTGRAHDAPKEFLADYQGLLQVDGYSAYTALVKASEGRIELAHCWAHVRREILEASGESPRRVAWLMGQIQAMYAVEKQLREGRAGPALREAVRQSQTAMVVRRLFKAMTRIRNLLLPGGALAKALDYALERRVGLERFLSQGQVEIDSNLVENAIRPCAIGRKNWLFVGHPEAGDHGAILYSLMASCRLHGINPLEYLQDLLTRLPGAKITEIQQYTPAEWAKARRPVRR